MLKVEPGGAGNEYTTIYVMEENLPAAIDWAERQQAHGYSGLKYREFDAQERAYRLRQMSDAELAEALAYWTEGVKDAPGHSALPDAQ
jgi:hypothetical protein